MGIRNHGEPVSRDVIALLENQQTHSFAIAKNNTLYTKSVRDGNTIGAKLIQFWHKFDPDQPDWDVVYMGIGANDYVEEIAETWLPMV